MDATKPKLTWKTVLLPTIGLTAFFFYILIFNVNIPEIIATASRANPLIYSAAVLVSITEVFFYAISWQALLNYLKVKLSFVRSFLYVWYGTFLDILIPVESISGELCRVYLVNREQPGTSGKVMASVVTQRLIGMGMNVIFLILGINLLLTQIKVNPIIFGLILLITVAIAAIMILILLVSANPKWTKKVVSSLVRVGEFITRGRWKQLNELKEQALKDAETFHDSMKELKRKPQMLIWPTVLLALNWICSLSVPYLVFLSLGYQVPSSVIFITGCIVVAVKSIPIGMLEVGVPEITMTTLYTSLLATQFGLGIAEVCATATILSRLITLWLRFGIGFVSQQWVELKMFLISKDNK
jgi:uncharacterized protein (TIRG00374 family)